MVVPFERLPPELWMSAATMSLLAVCLNSLLAQPVILGGNVFVDLLLCHMFSILR